MANRRRTNVNRDLIPEIDSLDAQRDVLERRLEDGYRRIDEAAIAGADIAEWETFWIQLLGEYEDVCRELKIAA
ncbi:MAG: hypothetical protein H0T18_06415 [Chloroflexia bacterium]|nr:hypothetical protein [Chloroflexia bacterium]